MVEDLQDRTRCGDCGLPPKRDSHKTDTVLRCPSCETILVRVQPATAD